MKRPLKLAGALALACLLTAQAAAAKPILVASVQAVRAICHNAQAMIATAASFRPCTSESGSPLSKRLVPTPRPIISTADGVVKPSQAARPPGMRPRSIPMAKPTWLDMGPGRNWHNAIRS